MKTESDLIYEILYPRVDKRFLQELYDSVFDQTKTKFFAFTYSEINKEIYEDIEYNLNKIGPGSAYNADQEKKKKYITSTSWQVKDTKQCIEEGIYRSYAVRFTGMYYESEWYVETELLYFGENVTEEQAKRISMFDNKINTVWNALRFVPYKPIVLPNVRKARDVELEEFEHMPWLVANIKQRKKLEINRAFSHYINLEIFIPFVENIKVKFPEEFVACVPLYSEDYTLIFPVHKKFVIAVMMVTNKKKEATIRYFLYHSELKKMYEWIYFRHEVYGHGFHYSLEVIKDLSTISEWNDHSFFNSSRTIDNENFWSNYVFKKENGEYLYLKEMHSRY